MFISVLSDLIHILKFIILCDCFFYLNKRNKYINTMVVSVMCVIVSLTLYLLDNKGISMFIYLVFIFVALSIVYDEKKSTISLIGIWLLTFIALLDQISAVFVHTTMNIIMCESRNIYVILTNILTCFICFVMGCVVRNKSNRGISDIGKSYLCVILVMAFIDSVVLVYLGGNINQMINIDNRLSLGIVFILVVMGVFLQMGMIVLLLISRNVYIEKEKLATKFLKEQQKHYKYLEMREEETKRFRHDIRSHMYTLYDMCNNQDYIRLKEYLSTINGKIDQSANKVSVNNGIVDAILNKYSAEAVEYGIRIKVTGHLPSDCNLDPFNLCTIFSNLLSNAIEAESKCDGDEVKICCRYTETGIIITFENDYDGHVVYEQGKIVTSKKDRIHHGLGLENVKKSVYKNNGYLDISTKDKIFKVIVIFEECRGKYHENSYS